MMLDEPRSKRPSYAQLGSVKDRKKAKNPAKN